MQNFHSQADHFLIVKKNALGVPELRFSGQAYQHAAIGSDRLVFTGRIDVIPGYSLSSNRSKTAEYLLTHLQKNKTLDHVKGQFIAVYIIAGQIRAYRSSFCPQPLFFGKFCISDSLSQVCVAESKFSLSKEYAYYFVQDVPAWQFDGPTSPVESIHRLPSNSTLQSTASGFEVLVNAFTPLNHHFNSRQTHRDAGRIILSHLDNSITESLNSLPERHIFCELSGGLDSSFITALVAQKNPNITSYVYTFPDHPSHQISIDFAKSVASQYGIKLEIINGNSINVPDVGTLTHSADEPADFYWQGALFGPIIQRICGHQGAVFTGFGADQILNRSSLVLSNLLQNRCYRHYFKTAKEMSLATDRSTLNYHWQALLSYLPRELMFKLMDITIGSYRPFATDEIADDISHFMPNPWLKSGLTVPDRKELAKVFDEGEVYHKRFFARCFAHPNLYYLAAPHLVWGPHLGETNTWQIHPFCDSRLIEASYNDISWHLIHDWSTLYKQALREAQVGILPEPLRLRQKDDFSFDGFYLRFLRKNRDALYALALQTKHLLEPHFDARYFDNVFEQTVFGVQNLQTLKLNRFLAYAIWAKNFKQKLERLQLAKSEPDRI